MPQRVARDDAFLRAAMRDHGASVLRLALSQTGSRADAEDVYQDRFRAIDSYTSCKPVNVYWVLVSFVPSSTS